jgi:hypothetical protein
MNMTDVAASVSNDLVNSSAADPADVQLVKYEAAKQAVIEALAETTDLEEACGIRNQAIVIKKLAQLKEDRALIDTATEIRLRAQRRIGQLLKEMAKRSERDPGRGGDRKSRSHNATVKPKTLDDLGLNKSESSRCQKVADFSEEEFKERTRDAKARAAGVRVSLSANQSLDHRDKLIRHLKSAIRRGEKEIMPFIDDFRPDDEIDCLFDRMAKVWGFIARERGKKRTQQAAEAELELEPDEVPADEPVMRVVASEAVPSQRPTTAWTCRPSLIAALNRSRSRRRDTTVEFRSRTNAAALGGGGCDYCLPMRG